MNQRTPSSPPTSALQGTVSFKDGLGVRLREMAGNDIVDRLVLCPELSVFEGVLRERVMRLSNFRNVRFPRVRSLEVKGTDKGRAVSVVADPVEGLRLVEIVPAIERHEVGLPVGTALQVAREILPALATLHDSRAVTHGAIGLERLVLTPSGRILLVDVVLGSALEKLQYPRSRLWREFRVAMPPSAGIPRFDTRADIVQVAVAVFALVLGRLLTAREFPDGMRDLLGAAVERLPDGTARPLSPALRGWFERALPVESRKPFVKALDAGVALDDVVKADRAYRATSTDLKQFFDRASDWLAGQRSAAAGAGSGVPGTVVPVPPATPSPTGPEHRRPMLRVVSQVPDDEEDEIRALEAELARLRHIEAEEARAAAESGKAGAPTDELDATLEDDALPLVVGGDTTPVFTSAPSTVVAGELSAPAAPVLAPRDAEAGPAVRTADESLVVEIDLEALVDAEGGSSEGAPARPGPASSHELALVDRASIERELAEFVERAALAETAAGPELPAKEAAPALSSPAGEARPSAGGPVEELVVEIDLDALAEEETAQSGPSAVGDAQPAAGDAETTPPPTLGDILAQSAREHALDPSVVGRVAVALRPAVRAGHTASQAPVRRRRKVATPPERQLTADVAPGTARVARRRRRLDEVMRGAAPLALSSAPLPSPVPAPARLAAEALPVEAHLAPPAAASLLEVAALTAAPLSLADPDPGVAPAARNRLPAQASAVAATLASVAPQTALDDAARLTSPLRLHVAVAAGQTGEVVRGFLVGETDLPDGAGSAEAHAAMADVPPVGPESAPDASPVSVADAEGRTGATPKACLGIEVLGYFESVEVLAIEDHASGSPDRFVPLVPWLKPSAGSTWGGALTDGAEAAVHEPATSTTVASAPAALDSGDTVASAVPGGETPEVLDDAGPAAPTVLDASGDVALLTPAAATLDVVDEVVADPAVLEVVDEPAAVALAPAGLDASDDVASLAPATEAPEVLDDTGPAAPTLAAFDARDDVALLSPAAAALQIIAEVAAAAATLEVVDEPAAMAPAPDAPDTGDDVAVLAPAAATPEIIAEAATAAATLEVVDEPAAMAPAPAVLDGGDTVASVAPGAEAPEVLDNTGPATPTALDATADVAVLAPAVTLEIVDEVAAAAVTLDVVDDVVSDRTVLEVVDEPAPVAPAAAEEASLAGTTPDPGLDRAAQPEVVVASWDLIATAVAGALAAGPDAAANSVPAEQVEAPAASLVADEIPDGLAAASTAVPSVAEVRPASQDVPAQATSGPTVATRTDAGQGQAAPSGSPRVGLFRRTVPGASDEALALPAHELDDTRADLGPSLVPPVVGPPIDAGTASCAESVAVAAAATETTGAPLPDAAATEAPSASPAAGSAHDVAIAAAAESTHPTEPTLEAPVPPEAPATIDRTIIAPWRRGAGAPPSTDPGLGDTAEAAVEDVPAPVPTPAAAGDAPASTPPSAPVAPWRRGAGVSPPPPVTDPELGDIIENLGQPYAQSLWVPPADTDDAENAERFHAQRPDATGAIASQPVWPIADRRGQQRTTSQRTAEPAAAEPHTAPSRGAHTRDDRHTGPVGMVPASPSRGRVLAVAGLVLLLAIGGAGGYYWYSRPAPHGDLVVTSTQEGLEVLVDGTVLGKTPATLSVPPGRHTIELRGFGASKTLPVEVAAGERTNAFVEWGRGPRTGSLRVTSTPPGARVLMGAEIKGLTPVTVEHVPVGTHEVVVETDKGSVRTTVKITADRKTEVDVPIYSGFLAVFAPVELRIFESGRLLGTTLDGRLLLPPGQHTIELVNQALGFRERRTVEVTPGRVTALSVTAMSGEIDVDAPAGTEVFVDGASRGVAPIGTLRVGAGTREVVLRHPELGQRRFVVTVGMKAPARVSFTAPR